MRSAEAPQSHGLPPGLPHGQHQAGDPLLGGLFGQIRQVLGLTEVGLARRLGTATSVIVQLERGHLPPIGTWHEVSRIISDIAYLARVDDRSLLERAAIQYRLTELQPSTANALSHAHPSNAGRDDPSAAGAAPARRPSRRRLLFSLTGPIVAAAGLVWGIQTHPTVLYKVAGKLPDAIREPVKWALDRAVLLNASRHDGLVWIDVGDPRVRKRDRLAAPDMDTQSSPSGARKAE